MAKDLPFDRQEIDKSALPEELRQLLDQSEKEYVGWNPEEQPQVVGTVADIQTNCDCGGYGAHNIIFIDSPVGSSVAVHCFHTILRSQVDERIRLGKISAGDLIAISYLGTKPSKVKGHADQNDYRVVVRQKGGIVPKA
jgi:hypothetical protein